MGWRVGSKRPPDGGTTLAPIITSWWCERPLGRPVVRAEWRGRTQRRSESLLRRGGQQINSQWSRIILESLLTLSGASSGSRDACNDGRDGFWSWKWPLVGRCGGREGWLLLKDSSRELIIYFLHRIIPSVSWQRAFLIDFNPPEWGRPFSGCTTHMFVRSHCGAQRGSDTILPVPSGTVRPTGKTRKRKNKHRHLGRCWTPNRLHDRVLHSEFRDC